MGDKGVPGKRLCIWLPAALDALGAVYPSIEVARSLVLATNAGVFIYSDNINVTLPGHAFPPTHPGKIQVLMQRVCFLLKVRPDRLAEYKERHRAVWPEMLDALRETGWHNYSLFLRDDGLLVGYLETPDFEAARRGMAGREVNLRWQRDMAPFFESLTGRPDEGMTALEEVFHLA